MSGVVDRRPAALQRPSEWPGQGQCQGQGQGQCPSEWPGQGQCEGQCQGRGQCLSERMTSCRPRWQSVPGSTSANPGTLYDPAEPTAPLRSVTCHWDHAVLSATRHRWMRPALTQTKRAGTQFACPRRMEGWVDFGGWLYTEIVYLSADSHPSK